MSAVKKKGGARMGADGRLRSGPTRRKHSAETLLRSAPSPEDHASIRVTHNASTLPQPITSNGRFLAALFGITDKDGHIAYTNFAVSPELAEGKHWKAKLAPTGKAPKLPLETNNYFSTAVVGKERTLAEFQRLVVVVLDDVKDGVLSLPPTYRLETSAGNFQVGYAIVDSPESRNISYVDRAIKFLVAAHLMADKSGNNAVRWVRMLGSNTKADNIDADGKPFLCALREYEMGRRYSIAEVLAAYGVTVDDNVHNIASPPPKNNINGTVAHTAHDDLGNQFRTLLTAGDGMHDAQVSLGMKLIASGTDPGFAMNILRAVTHDDGTDRTKGRIADIRRTIDTAVKKIAAGRMSSEYTPILDDQAPSASESPPPIKPLSVLVPDGRITDAEWEAAPEPPQQIVDRLILQDACGFVAPGSTGKTTLAIVEYIHIILDRPLWGRRIEKPGPVAFLTAEDSRQITIDRLKWCMDAMRLTATERRRVIENFYIDDVSAQGTQLVRAFEHGNLKPTILQDELIAKYRGKGISVLHLDPASLLGPGEVHGNDGGAAMNRAMRRVATEAQCCVQLINHVAQSVARGQVMDQYAARGTTAIVDNSRGQRQMVRLEARDLTFKGTKYQVPKEAISNEDVTQGRLLVILVHKLSYVEVDPTPIFIGRHGYEFMQLPHRVLGAARKKTVDQEMEIIAGFVTTELANGRRHSASSIYSLHLAELGGLKRQRAKDLIDEGLRIGRFKTAELPTALRKGSKTNYLVVVDLDDIDQGGV